jgi:hypothetical protein
MIKLVDFVKELFTPKVRGLEPEVADDLYLYEMFFKDIINVNLISQYGEDYVELYPVIVNGGESYMVDDNFDDEDDEDDEPQTKPIKKRVLAELDNYQLISSAKQLKAKERLYIVNPNGETWAEYIVGFIEIQRVGGEFKLSKAYQVNGVQVKVSYISEEYRGKGIGTTMYKMVLNTFGTIFSDELLYEGSRNLWLKHLVPYVLSKNGFFGAETHYKMYVPLTLQDAANDSLVWKMQRYMTSINPIPEMKKLQQLVGDMSFSNGELGTANYDGSSKELSDIINEYSSVSELPIEMGIVTQPDLLQALVVTTKDAAMFIYEQPDGDLDFELI